MNSITEESGVSLLDNIGKIACLSLNKLSFRPYLFHLPICNTQGLSRRIDTDNTSLKPLVNQLFRNQSCDSSSSTSHIHNSECRIEGECCKRCKNLSYKRTIDLSVKSMRCKRLKGKLVSLLCLNELHEGDLLCPLYALMRKEEVLDEF